MTPGLRVRVQRACVRGRFLIATDFDGTLTPIVSSPERAVLSPPTAELLRTLIGTPLCTLMVVSGRSLTDLRFRVPAGAILAGNHGLEIEGGGLSVRHEGAAALQAQLLEACSGVAGLLPRWPGAFIESKGLTATVHYRLVPDKHHAELLRGVRSCMGLYGTTFGLRCGKKALEIHPRVNWGKGAAVNWVRDKLELSKAGCICIGDDRTDESMFRDCGGAITIAVGGARYTAAEYRLRDPESVAKLLISIANRSRSQHGVTAIHEHIRESGITSLAG